VLVNKRIQKSIGMALVAAVAVTAIFSHQTFAQAATNNSTNVIKISPVRTDIQIAAGHSGTVPITVTNLTNSAININPVENDFTGSDENGTPALILDSTKYAPTHSLKRFLVPIGSTTIPAGQSVTINVNITVPVEQQAGGYFGAIRFAPTSPDDSSQLNLSPNVASLILLTVPGDVAELLNLTDFDIQQNGTNVNSPLITSNKNLDTYIRFENKGNLQESPFGQITVKNGSKVVSTTDFNVNEPRDEVLPDGARRWTEPVKGVGTFGHYTVTATITYGKNNITVTAVKTFWVIPTWMIYLVIGAAVLIIAIIIFLVLFIRARRRRATRNQLTGRYRR
jgi:hypothetical protein